jgi:hypothetical protein
MKRVTGIGGIFIKSANTGKLRDWYQKHLGIMVNYRVDKLHALLAA